MEKTFLEKRENNITKNLEGRRNITENVSPDIIKAKFKIAVEMAMEERRQEKIRRLPTPCSEVEILTMVMGFIESEKDAFKATSGVARYSISEKQLFYLKWVNEFYPNTNLTALIREAENGSPVIYDWRNSSTLITYLIQEYRTALELQDTENDREKTLSELPPWLQS